jgi:hypothetical protein
MRSLVAIAVLAGGLTFGAASYVSIPFRAAILWALGGSAVASTAVVMKRVVCRDGTILDYDDSRISFTKGGRTWGPYDRT